MAIVNVSIPICVEKIDSIKAAIVDREGNGAMTNQECIDWMSNYLTGKVKSLCYSYQLKQYNNSFEFDDPTVEE